MTGRRRSSAPDRATIYYYASGKAELFDEVVRGAVEANALLAEEVRAASDPAPGKLRRVIQSLMAYCAENFPCLYVFVQENLTDTFLMGVVPAPAGRGGLAP